MKFATFEHAGQVEVGFLDASEESIIPPMSVVGRHMANVPGERRDALDDESHSRLLRSEYASV
jgi:hypothetical protein